MFDIPVPSLNSLSLRERAGVRVFLVFNEARAEHPHPSPLPQGEGMKINFTS
jgi:hypothetical protein